MGARRARVRLSRVRRYTAEQVEATYTSGTESIMCFKDRKALLRKLREEISETGSLPRKLIRRVWQLASTDAPPTLRSRQ